MKLRFIILLLCACMLLTGCKKDPGQPDPGAEATTTSPVVNEEEGDPLRLVEAGASRYEIIFPEQADMAVNTAVGKLRSLFFSATGVYLPMKDDYLKAGETHDQDTCKILIGRTNYADSQTLSKGLRYNEWLVSVSGTNLVIIAFTDAGYTEAFDYLESEVFSAVKEANGGAELTMAAKTARGKLDADFEIGSWSIAGNDLSLYRIVYSGAEMATRAEALRQSIAERAGYYLDLVEDSQSTPSEYEILMGNTSREESALVDDPTYLEYIMQAVGSKLVVKTGGEHSLNNLYRDFMTVISTEFMDTVEMGDGYQLMGDYYSDPYDTSRAKGSDLRVMSLNIMAEWPNYGGDLSPVSARKEIFFSMLDYYQPTVIGLQEFSPSFYQVLEEEYHSANLWEILKFTNPNNSKEYVASTVMYRKDLYTLVDSGMQYYSKYNNGRCRCMTWAVLRDNKSGQEFCFMSTHWDGDSNENRYTIEYQMPEAVAFVNEMAKSYPVITTGDFNSNEWTNSFKQYLAQTNSVEAMYAAEQRLNIAGSWHDFGKDTPSAGSADHITVTKTDVKVLKFETMMYNEQIWCSDHAWLFADLQFIKTQS